MAACPRVLKSSILVSRNSSDGGAPSPSMIGGIAVMLRHLEQSWTWTSESALDPPSMSSGALEVGPPVRRHEEQVLST